MSTETQTKNQQDDKAPKPSALSTTQMLHLMRLEVDQAERTGTPITCLVACLMDFESSKERVLRKKLMPALFRVLKQVCFQNDVRGLGMSTDRFLLGVFPHVDPETLGPVGHQLLEKAHELSKSPLAPDLDVKLAVGLSHNVHAGKTRLESLIFEAETGLSISLENGGDRCVQWKDVETEIDKLREELDEQLSELVRNRDAFEQAQGLEDDWAPELAKRVQTVFAKVEKPSEEIVRMQKDVLAEINEQATCWRSSSTLQKLLEGQSQIDVLERRISKLTESLGVTEAELKRVASMKSVETGLSSIYRKVQGLSGDDDNAEAKSEMLKDIFEANLALRQ